MFEQNMNDIQEVVSRYFQGIFYGEADKLKTVFHVNALLFGDINNQSYYKNLEEYIEGVENRKCPYELGETFEMKIIGLDILGNIAMVKAHLPMLGFNYYDYLSLTKINGRWSIINKLFTNV